MITVSISINGNPILTRSATQGDPLGQGRYEYNLDDGGVVEHSYNAGAVVLAKMMLDKIDREFVTKDTPVAEAEGEDNGN